MMKHGTISTSLWHQQQQLILSSTRLPASPRSRSRSRSRSHPPTHQSSLMPQHGTELVDDTFHSIIPPQTNLLTICGFGSLLSETSARSTFPDLLNFRLGVVLGYRRIFTHACDIFFERGIANPYTREISSLSVEPCHDDPNFELIVTLFEIDVGRDPGAIAAFIQREHEFRFVVVEATDYTTYNNYCEDSNAGKLAVICARNTDENYKKTRCPPAEWDRRYGKHGLQSIWTTDILPCRVYLRHCALAAKKLGPVAEANFLDATVLSDGCTTIREWLEQNPEIMDELPPESLIGRYSG